MSLLKAFVYTLSAIVVLPSILAPLARQGRVFTFLQLGGCGLFLVVALVVVCFLLLGWSESASAEQKRKALEEMKRKWGWYVGKRVAFNLYGSDAEGVIMDQFEDDLYINYLHNAGCVSQTVRKTGEVTVI